MTTASEYGTGDDDVMAALLMRMWALASGHVLPDGPPDQLSEEQLIEFWADDMYLRTGRHASSSPALEAARDDDAVMRLEAGCVPDA